MAKRRYSTRTGSEVRIPKGSHISIVLRKGVRLAKNKAEARRTVMRALTLDISMDYRKRIDGSWEVHLSQYGVERLKRKHGFIDHTNARTRATPAGQQRTKVKVPAAMDKKDEAFVPIMFEL